MIKYDKDDITILDRGDITYYIYPKSVLVKIGNQYVSYNVYSERDRAGLSVFREFLLESEPYEYGTPSELISLATMCNVSGSNTSRRPIECE